MPRNGGTRGEVAASVRVVRRRIDLDDDSSDSDLSDNSNSGSSSSSSSYRSLDAADNDSNSSMSSLSSLASNRSIINSVNDDSSQEDDNDHQINSDHDLSDDQEHSEQENSEDQDHSDQDRNLTHSDSDLDNIESNDSDNNSNSDSNQDLLHSDTESISDFSLSNNDTRDSDEVVDSPAQSDQEELEVNNSPFREDLEVVDDFFVGIRDILSGISSRRRPDSPHITNRLVESGNSDSGLGSGFPGGTPVTMTAAAGRTSTPRNGISFECIICLELIDHPTSLDVSDLQGGQGDVGSARARGGARAARTQALQGLSKETVVATHCGHLYHQMCIEKWFIEQGRRTCPSCRKPVPKSKLIRIYPATSDVARNNDTVLPDLANIPGPSASRNTDATSNPAPAGAAIQPGQFVMPRNDHNDEPGGECTKGECQDVKLLHNTLMNDFNELQRRFNELRETAEFREAQNLSLVEESSRLHEENDRLKRQLNVSPASSTSSKRRRQ